MKGNQIEHRQNLRQHPSEDKPKELRWETKETDNKHRESQERRSNDK